MILTSNIEIDPKLLKIHRGVFLLGCFLETIWGLYLKYFTNMGQFDDIRVRILMSFVLLVLFLSSYKEFYKRHYIWLTLVLITLYTAQRYFLLSLNSQNWLAIIDCYTVGIMAMVVAPTLWSIFYVMGLSIFCASFFKEHDYAVLTNIVSMLPLIAAFKWSDFKNREELFIANEKLKQTATLSGAKNFMTVITHDVNNILQKINLLSELASLNQSNQEQSNQQIKREVNKLSKIINDFQDFINDKKIHIEPIDLNQLIENIQEIHSDKLNAYQIKFFNKVKNGNIYSDDVLIKNIVNTIINNAMDELKTIDKPNKTIIINNIETNNNLFILISNNGKKIDSSLKNKIFEPFYTTKEKGQGFGLGLSIAKEMAIKCNIDLYYDDTYEDTTFVLKFAKSIEN